jgi:tRNA(Arg) A34 adenosine deaminase TadA
MHMLDHTHYMRHAIELAAKVPERPFAALIVSQHTGSVLAEGWNQSTSNPTWHGEIVAINRFVEQGHSVRNEPLILYSTAEPCPMCQGAILWAGVQTVVYGSSIRFLQQLGWKQIDISASEMAERTPFIRCSVIGGILEAECNALFETAALGNSQ